MLMLVPFCLGTGDVYFVLVPINDVKVEGRKGDLHDLLFLSDCYGVFCSTQSLTLFHHPHVIVCIYKCSLKFEDSAGVMLHIDNNSRIGTS